MQLVVASLLIIGLFKSPIAADQAPSGVAAGKPAGGACSLLSRELVMKVSGAVNKHVFDLPPQEEPMGKSGSACEYADIRLQIDFLIPQGIEGYRNSKADEWVPVSGVGDRAYFHNNSDRYAQLIGWVGSRTFTIQMGVPFQSTAEKMKPNVITLANAIVAKLR